MSTTATAPPQGRTAWWRPGGPARTLLNKVPEITVYFWIIKILATTVGEAAADFLNVDLNLGLTGTTGLIGRLLAVVLAWPSRSPRYIPGVHWSAVVLFAVGLDGRGPNSGAGRVRRL